MIRLDGISKQNGHQIVFIEASTSLHKARRWASSVPWCRQADAVPDDHGPGATG